jgi:hypothetical protein
MPNSLIPDFPITTSEMPRSSLSKSDIAAPMRDMAEALDRAAGRLPRSRRSRCARTCKWV